MHVSKEGWVCVLVTTKYWISTPVGLKFFPKHEIVIAFSIIYNCGNGTSSWNPSRGKTRASLPCIFKTLATDSLPMQWLRKSTAIHVWWGRGSSWSVCFGTDISTMMICTRWDHNPQSFNVMSIWLVCIRPWIINKLRIYVEFNRSLYIGRLR